MEIPNFSILKTSDKNLVILNFCMKNNEKNSIFFVLFTLATNTELIFLKIPNENVG